MRGKVGQPVLCTIPMPPGPPQKLGARIEQPITRQEVVPWAPAELWSEKRQDENGELFTMWWVTTTLGSPPAGDFLIAWMSELAQRIGETEPVVGWVPLAVA